MSKTCKKCGMRFEDEKRFEIHKGVHGRKPKVSQYGRHLSSEMLYAEYYVIGTRALGFR